ncbi:MAG: NtaA/DmoA family FMN-dependent monooxygenase [Novosphingobium sp.]|nr:NtaA/DmoA family FMN-dependent monooxygenase [Novosphingobium sp.]
MAVRQMALGAMLAPLGMNHAAWKLFPDGPDPLTDIDAWVKQAQTAEAAKYDFIFYADWPSFRPGPKETIAREQTYANWPEPIAIVSALAALTSKVGIVATGSTTFNEPYNLARQFGTIDHFSRGRAGWNIVTSRAPGAPFNYGHMQEIPHAQRYVQAREFVQVVLGLWDSYEDDAFVRDLNTGYYFDPNKLHTLNHEGPHLRVRGPLNLARPPQGYPVLFQAGASEDGIDLCARYAEVAFGVPGTLEAARSHYGKLRERLAFYGRDESDVRYCIGFSTVVRESAAEAEDAAQAMHELQDPEMIKHLVSVDIEADVSDLGLDDFVTVDRLPSSVISSKSTDTLIRGWLEKEPMTVRQLFLKFTAKTRGTAGIHGTPTQVADMMEEWFTGGGCDGFILFPVLPSGHEDFARMVVPELQRRGLFRTEYSGTTLRDHLGLRRPERCHLSAGYDVPKPVAATASTSPRLERDEANLTKAS